MSVAKEGVYIAGYFQTVDAEPNKEGKVYPKILLNVEGHERELNLDPTLVEPARKLPRFAPVLARCKFDMRTNIAQSDRTGRSYARQQAVLSVVGLEAWTQPKAQ